MNKDKYRIVLDTNFIYHNPIYDFNVLFSPKKFDSLKDFIKDNDLQKEVKICIPEIVCHERVMQRLDNLNSLMDNLDLNLKQLEIFGVKNTAFYKKKDYRSKLDEFMQKIMKDNKLIILKTPKIDFDELKERAINKIVPFNNGDKGFKDTMIWYSIKTDAKKNKDTNYIILSDNQKDFREDALVEEFKEVSKSRLNVFSDLAELKVFFDKEKKLKLKIEEHHDEIKNNAIDKIALNVLNYLNSKEYYYRAGNVYDHIDHFSYTDNFIFEKFYNPELNIEDIEDLENDVYKINLNLRLDGKIRKMEKEEVSNAISRRYREGYMHDVSSVTNVVNALVDVDNSYLSATMIYPLNNTKDNKVVYFDVSVIYSKTNGSITIGYIKPSGMSY